jgi:hypothetical protein
MLLKYGCQLRRNRPFTTAHVPAFAWGASCGTQGFGWDAIFVPLGQPPARLTQGGRTWIDHGAKARTFAQMSLAEKSAISHRGRALRQFSVFLQDNEAWVTGRAEKRGAAPKAPVDDLFSFRRRRRMM